KPFIGRDAVARRIENGIETSLVYLGIDAEDADCIGNEQVFVNGRVVGLTTSGAYGHTVRQSLAFAYVEPVYVKSGANLEVEILGHRRAAKVLGEALYDPQNLRLRS
nr:aminomethyl transferase family protein [Desulfuromonadales bacterium]